MRESDKIGMRGSGEGPAEGGSVDDSLGMHSFKTYENMRTRAENIRWKHRIRSPTPGQNLSRIYLEILVLQKQIGTI